MNADIKNTLFILIFLVLLVLLLNACDREGCCSDRAYSFSGFVTDSITGLDIDSAEISLNDSVAGASWFTDNAGFYRGAEFPSVYTLYVQKNGYKTKDTVIDLFNDLTNVNFHLVPDTTK